MDKCLKKINPLKSCWHQDNNVLVDSTDTLLILIQCTMYILRDNVMPSSHSDI